MQRLLIKQAFHQHLDPLCWHFSEILCYLVLTAGSWNSTQEFHFTANQLSRQLDTWKIVSKFPLRKFSRLFHNWGLITTPVKLLEPIKNLSEWTVWWHTLSQFTIKNWEQPLTFACAIQHLPTFQMIFILSIFFFWYSFKNSFKCLLLAEEAFHWKRDKILQKISFQLTQADLFWHPMI